MLFDMPSGTLPQREHAVGGAHRRERLRDRGVHTAVHDAHRLAHARRDGQAPGTDARPPSRSSTSSPIVASNASSTAMRQRRARGRGIGTLVTRPMLRGARQTEPGATMSAGTWESHHAITTLMFRYAECVDARRLRRHRRAVRARSDHQRGRRRRDRRARRGHASSTSARTACTTTARCAPVTSTRTSIVDIDEVAGHGHGPFVVRRVPADRRAAAATDRDRPLPRPLRRGDGHDWHFERRHIIVDHVGDVREHLTFDLSGFVEEH